MTGARYGLCAFFAALMTAGASPAEAAAQRVLIVSGARAFIHDSIPAATTFFDRLGERNATLVWARRYGEGRVFYSGLGHLKETWRNRIRRRLVTRVLVWALGR